jgi:hypothetical protein
MLEDSQQLQQQQKQATPVHAAELPGFASSGLAASAAATAEAAAPSAPTPAAAPAAPAAPHTALPILEANTPGLEVKKPKSIVAAALPATIKVTKPSTSGPRTRALLPQPSVLMPVTATSNCLLAAELTDAWARAHMLQRCIHVCKTPFLCK